MAGDALVLVPRLQVVTDSAADLVDQIAKSPAVPE